MNSKTKKELNLFWLMHGNRKLVVLLLLCWCWCLLREQEVGGEGSS